MFEELKKIICKVLPDGDFSALTPESVLTTDLGIDSMKMVMLAIEIEDHFHIQFKDDIQLETVQDLIDFIESEQK